MVNLAVPGANDLRGTWFSGSSPADLSSGDPVSRSKRVSERGTHRKQQPVGGFRACSGRSSARFSAGGDQIRSSGRGSSSPLISGSPMWKSRRYEIAAFQKATYRLDPLCGTWFVASSALLKSLPGSGFCGFKVLI